MSDQQSQQEATEDYAEASPLPTPDGEQVEYLKQKGTLEIIAEVGKEGKCRHTPLRDVVPVSSSTLSDRLKTGVNLDLLEYTLIEEEDGTTHKAYQLTETGKRVYNRLKKQDLPKMYKRRRQILRETDAREQMILSHFEQDMD